MPSFIRAVTAATRTDDIGECVRSLLGGFRLLEAAGVCECIASRTHNARPQLFEWWSTLAVTARAYRVALFDTGPAGYAAIESWIDGDRGGAGRPYFSEEKGRLSLEYENWLNVVPGGGAYVAWLTGYVAAAELDGRRASRGVRRCAAIESQFLDASDIARAPSLYEQLQLAGDLLPRFLPLPQHPISDMRRFAMLPEMFP